MRYNDARVLMQTKGKLKGAKKGYDLLKKKADALKKEFQTVMQQIIMVRIFKVQEKRKMDGEFKEAMLSLAQANLFSQTSNFAGNQAEQVKPKSNIRLHVSS